MLTSLAVLNYRTLRDLVVPLAPLTLVTGANGSGKSNLYRALRLLADTAQGGLIASLAREGGLGSTLWAGPEAISRAMRSGEVPVQGTGRQGPLRLGLGFAGDDFGYSIDLGQPQADSSVFPDDPAIKGEFVWAGPVARPAALLADRRNALARVRDDDDRWQVVHDRLGPFDSMLGHAADPKRAPELMRLRAQINAWRFYDHFRTDATAPARSPQVGTHTPVLGHDGADLAAALHTIRTIGDAQALDETVEDAFPGSRVSVTLAGRAEVLLQQHGLLRPLRAAEWSDGTLRYLLWTAALLSPRPAPLLVLNEPETSLHPDLLPALGRLIVRAARQSQVIVVSHASRLIAALEESSDCLRLTLEKSFGETRVAGLDPADRPPWHWMPR